MKQNVIINHTPEIEAYLKSIRKFDVLTKDEEKNLFKEYQTATPERKSKIIETLVNSNQKFVFSEAKKYAKGNDDKILDFVNEGSMGLIKAIDKFDVSKEYRFITFAVWYIKQAMTNHAQTDDKFMRNANANKIGNNVLKIKAAFYQENHRDPSVEEIKEALAKKGIKIKKDSDLEDVIQNSIDSVWGDESTFESNPRFIQHSAVDNEYETEVEAEDNSNRVNNLLNKLDARSAEVIRQLFGIGRDNPVDPEVVAENMGLTPTRILQIKKAAIKKMQEFANAV